MSEEQKALVPIKQKQVLFYDDELTAVLADEDGRQQVYVPLRPLVDNLGLSWSGQYERLQRDAVLSQEIRSVRVTRTEPGRSAERETAEVAREMVCLPLDYLNGWLFGINANRVKEEIRERLIRYQRESYRVLYEAFQEGRLTADSSFDELLAADSPAARAYKMAAAIMKMARQQLLLESHLKAHTVQLADHEQRLEEVEALLGDPDRYISNAQASRISQAVKAVAMELSQVSGRNEYGGVYGELYRRYDVASYRELPASKYEDAMSWLREWYQQLTDRDLPF